MENAKVISGPEAFERMRLLKRVPGSSFGVIFFKCELTSGNCGQIRKYEHCRIRPSMRDENINVPAEHYLYFEDLDTELPKQCFKKLIRFVSFPPSYQWLKVKWFN